MLIPYGIGAYKRSDLPEVVLQNMYAEKAPEEPNKLTLLPRPALTPDTTVGAGPFRGLFQQDAFLSGPLFAVSGQSLYSGQTSLGTISGTSLVAMAAALNVLLIANGTGLYTSDGTSVTTVAFPDGAGVVDVAYLGGYALAARAGTRHIYFTLDTTTWDGLDYVSAEQGNDNLVGFSIVSGQLWVFCETHTEIFQLSGDSTAPVQPVEGRVFDKGALTRTAIVNLDNTVFWVGNDSIVYRGAGTPQRVSDHGIEEQIAASDVSDISAWAFPWNGHLFYVLHLTSGTWLFDVATAQWFQAASYGQPRWRALTGLLMGRNIIAADISTNQIWQLADGVYADGSDPIQRLFTVILQQDGFVDNIMLDCSTGELPAPTSEPGLLEMRTSRDGGMTWNIWRQAWLGAQGKYRKRVGFRRIGMVDSGDMILQFRITDPVASSVRFIRMNEGLGGLSR